MLSIVELLSTDSSSHNAEKDRARIISVRYPKSIESPIVIGKNNKLDLTSDNEVILLDLDSTQNNFPNANYAYCCFPCSRK